MSEYVGDAEKKGFIANAEINCAQLKDEFFQ